MRMSLICMKITCRWNSFSGEWFRTKTRFDTEANSRTTTYLSRMITTAVAWCSFYMIVQSNIINWWISRHPKRGSKIPMSLSLRSPPAPSKITTWKTTALGSLTSTGDNTGHLCLLTRSSRRRLVSPDTSWLVIIRRIADSYTTWTAIHQSRDSMHHCSKGSWGIPALVCRRISLRSFKKFTHQTPLKM